MPAAAQEQDTQLWTTATATTDLSDDVSLTGQFVARFSDRANGPSELQYQADIAVKLTSRLTVGGGYSYVPRYDQGDLTTREHRIRQQASLKLGTLLGGEVESRLRLEQRWRSDSDDVALRLRPRLQWTRQIGPDELSVRLRHESFIHLNDTDWTGDARYARARNSALLTRRLGSSITGEVGYINQYSLADTGPDEMVHALTLGISFDF